MANGEGCKCFARCENDCCCDVEWRSEREIELEAKVKELENMLWQVLSTINFCSNISKDLPDSFDDQLREGIETYFKEKDNG